MNIWHTPEREQLRKTVRAFAEREVLPHVDEWERSGELPRELHRKAGETGLLGAGLPVAVGGGGGDGADSVIICEEMHYAGSPVGRIPTQYDYADYREVAGVKIPFRWTMTWLDGRENVELTEVQANVAIDPAKFAKPKN